VNKPPLACQEVVLQIRRCEKLFTGEVGGEMFDERTFEDHDPQAVGYGHTE
jgi:hypothetical protein